MTETLPPLESVTGTLKMLLGLKHVFDIQLDPALEAAVFSRETYELAASQTAFTVNLGLHVNKIEAYWVRAINSQAVLVAIDTDHAGGPHVPAAQNYEQVGPLGCKIVIYDDSVGEMPYLYFSNPDNVNTCIFEVGVIGSWTS